MNGKVFLQWYKDQLLPRLQNPSVIVMDNASYHNIRTEETIAPTMSNLKSAMTQWLQDRNIPFNKSDTKPKLYEKILQNKVPIVYKTNELANIFGHVVLRTPVRMCEFNPIELVWAQVKGHVARNNTTFRLSDVIKLTYEGFKHITKDVWQSCEHHVRKIEQSYWESEGIAPSTVDPVIINLQSDSSDDDGI